MGSINHEGRATKRMLAVMISKRRLTCGFPGLFRVRKSCPVSDHESLSIQMSRPAVRQNTAWLVSELDR
jgi:hypothetical protein